MMEAIAASDARLEAVDRVDRCYADVVPKERNVGRTCLKAGWRRLVD